MGIVQKLEISRIICLALTLKVSLSGAAKQPRIISFLRFSVFIFHLMRYAWQNAQFFKYLHKYLNTTFRDATLFNSVKFRFRDNLHFADLMYKEKPLLDEKVVLLEVSSYFPSHAHLRYLI